MTEWWKKANTAAAAPLTAEQLAAAFKAIEDEPPYPKGCKTGHHLISATEKARGYGVCINCGSPITIIPRND